VQVSSELWYLRVSKSFSKTLLSARKDRRSKYLFRDYLWVATVVGVVMTEVYPWRSATAGFPSRRDGRYHIKST
jgi:hypothetical protein